jgi:hypothetical protein
MNSGGDLELFNDVAAHIARNIGKLAATLSAKSSAQHSSQHLLHEPIATSVTGPGILEADADTIINSESSDDDAASRETLIEPEWYLTASVSHSKEHPRSNFRSRCICLSRITDAHRRAKQTPIGAIRDAEIQKLRGYIHEAAFVLVNE